MALPEFLAISAIQVVTAFKQVLHGTPVLFRVTGEKWRSGVVLSEAREVGVVSLESEATGCFWGQDEIRWPLLDVSHATELGIRLQTDPERVGAAPEPDGGVYAKYDEGEQFRGLFMATWQEVAGARQHFRMMAFKDPMGGAEQAVHWARWGVPSLIWRAARDQVA